MIRCCTPRDDPAQGDKPFHDAIVPTQFQRQQRLYPTTPKREAIRRLQSRVTTTRERRTRSTRTRNESFVDTTHSVDARCEHRLWRHGMESIAVGRRRWCVLVAAATPALNNSDVNMNWVREIGSWAAIVIVAVLAAVLYGVVHDQVTARICVEYFTIGHAPVFSTQSPTLLGLGWGIIATWWVGFILGCPLAIAARWGNRPKISASELLTPLATLLVVMAIIALFSGAAAGVMARAGKIQLTGAIAERISPDRHAVFLIDAFAHSASYFVGFVGGIIVEVQTWWRRRILAGRNTIAELLNG